MISWRKGRKKYKRYKKYNILSTFLEREFKNDAHFIRETKWILREKFSGNTTFTKTGAKRLGDIKMKLDRIIKEEKEKTRSEILPKAEKVRDEIKEMIEKAD